MQKRPTEMTKKTDKPDGKPVLCREHSVQFFVQFFYKVKLHGLTYGLWGPLGCM